MTRVTNWEGTVVSHPAVVARPRSVEEVAAIMRDRGRYPAPVRPCGSNHSTTPVCAADGGTLLDLSGMDRILSVTDTSVTAEAGALSIDVAHALRERGLQHHVNVELGNLTLGSMATAGAKDSSFPGEHGWPWAYVSGVRMVTADGEVLDVDEERDPGLMRAIRSSHGTLGAVCEVTMRARPLEAMSVRHETLKLDEFCDRIPELLARDESMMLYLFPHLGLVTMEWRRYAGGEAGAGRRHRAVWRLRNFAWQRLNPTVAHVATRAIPWKRLRYGVIDTFNRSVHVTMDRVLHDSRTHPTDQLVRYPEKPPRARITFSIWCFPAEAFGAVLRDYAAFAAEHRARTGWRVDHTHVGFSIARDTSALLSPSWDGPVLTIDPICTGGAGWERYAREFNEFAAARGGTPLLNQTPGLTGAQVRSAFGARLDEFRAVRARLDPGGRLLNPHLRELIGE